MPELQRPPFIDRASAELEELTRQARSGAKDAEEVMTEYWENLQKLVDDLVTWFSDEVERVGRQAEEQRKRLESRLQSVVNAASAPVKQVAKRATGQSATSTTAAAGKSGAEKKAGAKKKAPAKAGAKKKAPAKKAGAKKAGSKKAGAKKAGTKKAGTKKAGTKKAGTKKAPAKQQAAEPKVTAPAD